MPDGGLGESGGTISQRRVILDPSASRRITQLAAAEGAPDLFLRLEVSGGGCSGFQYGFTLDRAMRDDDRVFENEGARLVVDDVSLDLLDGSEVAYVADLSGASFQVRNPNATASCGCGSSFAVG